MGGGDLHAGVGGLESRGGGCIQEGVLGRPPSPRYMGYGQQADSTYRLNAFLFLDGSRLNLHFVTFIFTGRNEVGPR